MSKTLMTTDGFRGKLEKELLPSERSGRTIHVEDAVTESGSMTVKMVAWQFDETLSGTPENPAPEVPCAEELDLSLYGSNLIGNSYATFPFVESGVTWNKAEDGTVTATGTATGVVSTISLECENRRPDDNPWHLVDGPCTVYTNCAARVVDGNGADRYVNDGNTANATPYSFELGVGEFVSYVYWQVVDGQEANISAKPYMNIVEHTGYETPSKQKLWGYKGFCGFVNATTGYGSNCLVGMYKNEFDLATGSISVSSYGNNLWSVNLASYYDYEVGRDLQGIRKADGGSLVWSDKLPGCDTDNPYSNGAQSACLFCGCLLRKW